MFLMRRLIRTDSLMFGFRPQRWSKANSCCISRTNVLQAAHRLNMSAKQSNTWWENAPFPIEYEQNAI